MLGYAEELEFFGSVDAAQFEQSVGLKQKDVMTVVAPNIRQPTNLKSALGLRKNGSGFWIV